MRKVTAGCMVVAMAFALTGCGGVKVADYTKDTLIMEKNNKVVEVAVEDYSAGQYNMDDLEEYIKTNTDTYNTENGADHIKFVELDTSNISSVKLGLEYASVDDYNKFNDTELVITKSEDLATTTSFIDASGNAVTASEIAAKSGNYVLSVTPEEDVDIKAGGKVLYCSSNCTFSNGVVTALKDQPAMIVYQ